MADLDGESTAAAAAALVQMMEKVSAALQLSELFNERRRCRPLHGIIHGSLLGLRLCLRYTYVYSSVQPVIVSGRIVLLLILTTTSILIFANNEAHKL